jgi:hypothetical protein
MGMTPGMGHKAGLRARGRRRSRGVRGMEEGAEAAVTAPRLRGRAGRGLCRGDDGGYDAVGFRGAEGDTGGGGCRMRGAGRGHGDAVDALAPALRISRDLCLNNIDRDSIIDLI